VKLPKTREPNKQRKKRGAIIGEDQDSGDKRDKVKLSRHTGSGEGDEEVSVVRFQFDLLDFVTFSIGDLTSSF
jgi:hypothetical protein